MIWVNKQKTKKSKRNQTKQVQTIKTTYLELIINRLDHFTGCLDWTSVCNIILRKTNRQRWKKSKISICMEKLLKFNMLIIETKIDSIICHRLLSTSFHARKLQQYWLDWKTATKQISPCNFLLQKQKEKLHPLSALLPYHNLLYNYQNKTTPAPPPKKKKGNITFKIFTMTYLMKLSILLSEGKL